MASLKTAKRLVRTRVSYFQAEWSDTYTIPSTFIIVLPWCTSSSPATDHVTYWIRKLHIIIYVLPFFDHRIYSLSYFLIFCVYNRKFLLLLYVVMSDRVGSFVIEVLKHFVSLPFLIDFVKPRKWREMKNLVGCLERRKLESSQISRSLSASVALYPRIECGCTNERSVWKLPEPWDEIIGIPSSV